MVLEMLLTGKNATLKSWWKLLAIGAIYATVGLLLAAWVFPNYGSMVMIFLTVIAASYLIHELIIKEEEYDEEQHNQFDIFSHHSQAVSIFMLLFFGMMIAYTFWYAVLPWASTSEHGIFQHLDIRTMFEAQNDTVARITGGHYTGAVTGYVTSLERFNIIFTNNMWVLFFSLLFGLFYGYGAIFVLAWNASVIAAAAGSNFKRALSGGLNWFEQILAFFASWLAYMPHGVFEILAYFVAALASGILGAAIARRIWNDPDKTNRVFIDFVEYTVLAVIILFIAAIIEVWITPALVL